MNLSTDFHKNSLHSPSHSFCSVTFRDEIAGCSEKAYDFLSINDARKMLLFTSDKELTKYIEEVIFYHYTRNPIFSLF